ncbi:Arc family DNA-binding protein [Buttiauxella noackiae]|uniref:Arc family DNA-binding protein n=1 Tax=Buttiauxella noackiae TaxID=82992 RepID=UPI0035A5C92E
MRGTRNIAPFGLRMPEEIRDAIQERANKNGRSLNSEILQILFDTIHNEGQPDGWLEKIMSLIEKKDPNKEEDRESFALAVCEAIREIVKRIEKENGRLLAISNAQLKFQPPSENKKPT